MKCSMCESKEELKKGTINEYRYTESGLNNVILRNITCLSCMACGEEYYNFGDVDQLHKLIAETLIKKKDILMGTEIRFLRKYLGYSSNTFSRIIGYDISHLSRIENGKNPVTEPFDRFIRLLVLDHSQSNRDYNFHDFLDSLEDINWVDLSFSPKEGWKLENVA